MIEILHCILYGTKLKLQWLRLGQLRKEESVPPLSSIAYLILCPHTGGHNTHTGPKGESLLLLLIIIFWFTLPFYLGIAGATNRNLFAPVWGDCIPWYLLDMHHCNFTLLGPPPPSRYRTTMVLLPPESYMQFCCCLAALLEVDLVRSWPCLRRVCWRPPYLEEPLLRRAGCIRPHGAYNTSFSGRTHCQDHTFFRRICCWDCTSLWMYTSLGAYVLLGNICHHWGVYVLGACM